MLRKVKIRSLDRWGECRKEKEGANTLVSVQPLPVIRERERKKLREPFRASATHSAQDRKRGIITRVLVEK